MPVNLNVPIQPPQLSVAKVVAIKIENNVEQWVETWVSFGSMIDGVFVEYVDPITHIKVTPAHYKIEDGNHPLQPGASLRRCQSCEKWYGLETACSCGGATVPYDGLTRLMDAAPVGANMHDAISSAIYNFLLNEIVPDPQTGELKALLDATEGGQ